jgi:hypothetical protein
MHTCLSCCAQRHKHITGYIDGFWSDLKVHDCPTQHVMLMTHFGTLPSRQLVEFHAPSRHTFSANVRRLVPLLFAPSSFYYGSVLIKTGKRLFM